MKSKSEKERDRRGAKKFVAGLSRLTVRCDAVKRVRPKDASRLDPYSTLARKLLDYAGADRQGYVVISFYPPPGSREKVREYFWGIRGLFGLQYVINNIAEFPGLSERKGKGVERVFTLVGDEFFELY